MLYRGASGYSAPDYIIVYVNYFLDSATDNESIIIDTEIRTVTMCWTEIRRTISYEVIEEALS